MEHTKPSCPTVKALKKQNEKNQNDLLFLIAQNKDVVIEIRGNYNELSVEDKYITIKRLQRWIDEQVGILREE